MGFLKMGIQSAVHLLDDTSHAGDDRRKQTGRIGQGRCFQIFQGNVPDAQMTVVNHGGHEAGVILMYAEIEYNGQVHPGNVRDILQNGFIGGSNRGLLTVPSTGKVTVSNTNKDREFVTAYELDIDGTITSDVSAEVNGKTVSDGDYIADGEVVELTFTTAGDYTVNGELVRAAANDTYEIEATEAIMVRSVSNYMTEEDIADIVDAYNPGTPTGATITRSGDTLNIVLNNTVSDWTDVSGTGLFVLAEDLLEDNSILITFPDGSAERIDKGTNAAAAAAQLTPKLGNVSDLTPTPIVITVTVENAGSGASVEYTVNLSQAD